jgi:hypothetical protein
MENLYSIPTQLPSEFWVSFPPYFLRPFVVGHRAFQSCDQQNPIFSSYVLSVTTVFLYYRWFFTLVIITLQIVSKKTRPLKYFRKYKCFESNQSLEKKKFWNFWNFFKKVSKISKLSQKTNYRETWYWQNMVLVHFSE